MANRKISELNELTTPLNSDVLPIVNGGETKKIKVENLLISKNIICVQSTNKQDGFTKDIWAEINFNNVYAQNGNKLTFENNGIKIGEGIKYVRVSYNIWVETDAITYVWINIKKNNEEMNQDIHDFDEGMYLTMTNSIIIPVEEGDIIKPFIVFNNPSVDTRLPGNIYNKSVIMSVEEI